MDDHYDPAQPPTDVKVAGSPTGTWSRPELDEADSYQPAGRSPRHAMLIKVGIAAAAALALVGAGGAALAMTGGSGSAKKTTSAAAPKAQPQNMAPDVATLQNQVDQSARNKVLDRASRAAQSDAGKAPALSAKGAVPTPSSSSSGSSGSSGGSGPTPVGPAQAYAKSLLSSWGWSGGGQFSCLVQLWDRESGWNAHAANPSGAYGIPQALPGDKMASAGSDWHDNPNTQIRWGFGYIKDRYGSPCGAWAHSQATGWY